MKRRGQPQWSRSPRKGSCLDRCRLGRLSEDSSQVSNEVSASHARGNDEHNNDVDIKMDTEIDVGVIEAVGTSAPGAAAIGGGVLVSDVGGGGGVVPLVAEAARGKELVKHRRKSFTTSPRLRNNEKRCEIRMEKVMMEKAYISQSIATGEEMLQVWDKKFLSSTCIGITLEEYIRACLAELGNGWLPRGRTSLAKFKNQAGQPFLARHMVYRYLKYCPGAPVYTANVLQKLLTRGKKLGMDELEFYCPCTHERELCPWYLELMEQMPISNFELDLYLEYVAKSSHQSSWRTKTLFPSLPMATNNDLEELSFAAMHKHVRPLSPIASVGEVTALIGDYMQLLDAINWELYMLDWWIHGLG
ncbi:hypothetical protein SELMODRAFT_425730 [Selaginella moellendorffii]|uniref:Uncharacterized protein n=1 Tax=Selaginella moellendorffii TaxID=88036 RepID=D8SU34_SELML|nr:hypothetical protein SELMODRAFT_425730 [Selaginella moellendorffii]